MYGIYISHRHADAPECACWLYDRLTKRFGSGYVIGADFAGLKPNHGFRQAIARTVGSCKVLLVMIGRGWFGADSAGRSAFEDPDDLVRVEIAAALARGVRVIPVLAEGASMPRADQLPELLAPLAGLQGLELSLERRDATADDLIRELSAICGLGNEVPVDSCDGLEVDPLDGLAGTRLESACVLTPAGIAPGTSGAPFDGFERLLEKSFKASSSHLNLNPMFNLAPDEPLEQAKEASSTDLNHAEPARVLLGASAPATAAGGEEFSARFVAYVAEEEERVLGMLSRLSPRATSHPRLRTCRWRVGTLVHVTLGGKWLQVTPPVQQFVWQGSQVLLDFDVLVADDAPDGATLLKFDVAIDGVVVASIRIDLGLGKSARQSSVNTVKAEAARTAFASYASADRARVLDRVAAVRISAGLDVFLDCLSLHPSEEWKLRLGNEIRSRDLFLLFWTAAAAESEWVTWEWRTALADKGKDAVQVHPLESGVMPPEQLKDLHFGDVMMLVRDATTKGAAGNP